MIITERKCKCAMCGAENTEFIKYGIHVDSSENDLSFNADRESVEGFIINKCDCCGYVSITLEDKALIKPKYLRSIEYKTCDTAADCEASKRFICLAMICKAEGDFDKAIGNMFCAMWTANSEEAKNIVADKIINMFFQSENKNCFSDLNRLRVIDLLRRMARFREAKMLCIRFLSDDVAAKKVCAFEYTLIENKDTGIYYMKDAENVKHSRRMVWAKLRYMLNFGKICASKVNAVTESGNMAYAV